MPDAAVQLHQDRARGPMTGNALIRPYAAAGASLALIPVSFTATPDGATHFTTTATLSGPLGDGRSEEHTSELQSLMRISYAVFCLKKKNDTSVNITIRTQKKV